MDIHPPTAARAAAASPPSPTLKPARIESIDALRGLVILLMLVDHTREFFFLHAQVSDPMDIAATSPALFATRVAAHLCAPVFIALTGLAAFLYGDAKGSDQAASAFLFKRGLFLVALEWTVINFAWTFDLTPATIFLQVIWAIGLSMIALSALLHLPRSALIAIAGLIILGHNLIDGVHFEDGTGAHAAWAVLHDRGHIALPWGATARTSYPLLPWIGVIALGYAIGPWFRANVSAATRRKRLAMAGAAALVIFVVLRSGNFHGEPLPWSAHADPLRTVMSVFNLTKYPPSAAFLLLTLGIGALLLAGFERLAPRLRRMLVIFGAAPLFFYMLHLYLLHIMNRLAATAWPAGETGLVSVQSVGWVWLLAMATAIPCWFACRWFAARKRASSRWWMRYL
ncbi:DUF1624 domain-containing protein [Sphingomonas colocasiae]|uniref:Heparan-alpha-glucosaminide N-acetyltransferase domain-containing protein n=1 Tax=Sphingomonas colocasiae TaxID=1848973 RepID=A0ABS7PKP3_9SPHN|nr:heparan-alpha-glucosaminide N-acetyltransferase domain-containing protein [Sphingomonas colocasiae]MBY8821873.1 heparan-alpha-glucosaminide N-acetyltransferase domain-containing protein [Sphingomonas colocasiae]